MYSDKKQSKTKYIIFALALILTAALIYGLFGHSGRDISLEGAEAIKDAIVRSARQCYVVEGVYPPNLEYLEDHYGLQVNHENFYVTYEAFASNLPPTVKVAVRKG